MRGDGVVRVRVPVAVVGVVASGEDDDAAVADVAAVGMRVEVVDRITTRNEVGTRTPLSMCRTGTARGNVPQMGSQQRVLL